MNVPESPDQGWSDEIWLDDEARLPIEVPA